MQVFAMPKLSSGVTTAPALKNHSDVMENTTATTILTKLIAIR